MDELRDAVDGGMDALDECMAILGDLEEDLAGGDLRPGMRLHDLYDMAEDVSESARLRRAESALMRRGAGSLDL